MTDGGFGELEGSPLDNADNLRLTTDVTAHNKVLVEEVFFKLPVSDLMFQHFSIYLSSFLLFCTFTYSSVPVL